jgi:hypothetical protein
MFDTVFESSSSHLKAFLICLLSVHVSIGSRELGSVLGFEKNLNTLKRSSTILH